MIITQEKGLKLYRYDHQINGYTPVNSWNSDHANHTEYANKSKGRNKNMADLYFFFDSRKLTEHLGKYRCETLQMNNYYLTSTELIDDIKIIDFSNCQKLSEMIDIITKYNFNILIDDFKIEGTGRDFSEFIPGIFDLRLFQSSEVSPLYDVACFGQLLTDFENGIKFKKAVQLIDPLIEGYCWYENHNPCGLTYCLFNSGKLTSPISELKYI